jgi:hypothetical protein
LHADVLRGENINDLVCMGPYFIIGEMGAYFKVRDSAH